MNIGFLDERRPRFSSEDQIIKQAFELTRKEQLILKGSYVCVLEQLLEAGQAGEALVYEVLDVQEGNAFIKPEGVAGSEIKQVPLKELIDIVKFEKVRSLFESIDTERN